MTREVEKQETYREQLARLARSLAHARDEDVLNDLASGTPLSRVTMFTAGNLDKRFEKIRKQVEFVGDAFDDLDGLIDEFITSTALLAYDTGVSDGEQFLQWLERSQHPGAEQRDYITCQRARHAVEEIARRDRLGHIHYQELLSLADQLAAELDFNRALRVHLNPIHAWSQFETRVLLDNSAETPAVVLFYAVKDDVRTALLEPDGIERVRELGKRGECTLDQWRHRIRSRCECDATRAELAGFCRELTMLGLVALS